MNEIGIMQGRLSPPVQGRLQTFPWQSWEEEFRRARDCGFDAIEWLFEAEGYEQNPIWTVTGLENIRCQIDHTGVQVPSLCADYFMAHPFFRVSEKERTQSIEVLNNLIVQSAKVGVMVILVPVLEVSEVRTETEKAQLLDSLREPLRLAQDHGIRLGLETELPSGEYYDLVERGTHPALGVYYDTGNATAKGYDIAADVRLMSPLLCGIHIKDRMRAGPSKLLGQGDANFDGFFAALSESQYAGPIILQTAFDEDFESDARAHLRFVTERLAQAIGNLRSSRSFQAESPSEIVT